MDNFIYFILFIPHLSTVFTQHLVLWVTSKHKVLKIVDKYFVGIAYIDFFCYHINVFTCLYVKIYLGCPQRVDNPVDTFPLLFIPYPQLCL